MAAPSPTTPSSKKRASTLTTTANVLMAVDTFKRGSLQKNDRASPTAAKDQGKRGANHEVHGSGGGKSIFVHEPEQETYEDTLDHYKAGNWGNRGTYLPVLQWAPESQTMRDRFRDLIEAKDTAQIKILLHSGVPVNLLIYPQKRTALHRAAEMGDELLCQLLLSFKANPLIEDDTVGYGQGEKSHLTAKDIAQRSEQLQLVHLFNLHLGQTDKLDMGLDAAPLRSEKPLRIHLRAYEPGFMSTQ